MNNLIEPCKKYIKDKLGIELHTDDVNKYIRTASNSLNLSNLNALNKENKKLILTTVLELVNKDNNLESVLETLETERNTPVVAIPYDFEDTYTQPTYHYKTLLILLKRIFNILLIMFLDYYHIRYLLKIIIL